MAAASALTQEQKREYCRAALANLETSGKRLGVLQKIKIRRAMKSDKAVDRIINHAEDIANFSLDSETPILDKLEKWLQFFVDHQEQIVAFIEFLMKWLPLLFAVAMWGLMLGLVGLQMMFSGVV